MKRSCLQRGCAVAITAASLLLILLGIFLTYRVFQQNERNILNNEDKHLLSLAESVDRSMVSYLNRQVTDLSYVVGRRGFLEAEETWLATGDPNDLLFRMEEGLVSQYQMSRAMLVVEGEKVLLSTDGRTDYSFPFQVGKQGDVSIWPCLSGGGEILLAFFIKNPSGVVYASIIDLTTLYQRVAGDLPVDRQEQILLMGSGERTLIHTGGREIHVDDVQKLTPETSDFFGLQTMLDWDGGPGTAFYEADPDHTGSPYTARMAMVPVEYSVNGFFSIAVTSNYEQFIEPIEDGILQMFLFGGFVVLGALLLLFLVAQSDRNTRKALREITVLQEKNAAMEELNAKTRELAHHQRLETIGTLTSSIAHEFNNLLTPIMGYSIMAMEKLSPEQESVQEDLLEIYDASRKAKDIISRLSDLSRKNTGLSYQYIAPDELAKKALQVSAAAKPPLVEVKSDLNCRHVWLYGNETQLSQLLLNLLLNAYHAMPEGGTVTITTKVDGHAVIFRVEDTGCGISEENLGKIFEPFYTTKETGKGTGLGLAIARQVVENHQGSIRVASQVGKGTVFTVTFPVQRRETN